MDLQPHPAIPNAVAPTEVPSDEPDANKAVQKLRRRIDGLVALIKSSEELNLVEIELPYLSADNWPDSHTLPDITPPSDGAELSIFTDEGLFSLLLSNVYQNAIHAAQEAVGVPDVAVKWGYTDRNYWVRVTNSFVGDRLRMEDVLAIGNSTKMAHQGQGLALVEFVADRLGVAINLVGGSGTASFSLSGARNDV